MFGDRRGGLFAKTNLISETNGLNNLIRETNGLNKCSPSFSFSSSSSPLSPPPPLPPSPLLFFPSQKRLKTVLFLMFSKLVCRTPHERLAASHRGSYTRGRN